MKGNNLDKKVKTNEPCRRNFQYFAAITASIGTLCTGTVLGWPSQIDKELLNGEMGFEITLPQLGWIFSISSLGAALFSLIIGNMCEKVGRKTILLLLSLLMLIGWIIIVLSSCFWFLMIGRFITGMAAGSACVVVPMYINEISHVEIRGSLGCLTQLTISIGILYANILGYSLDIFKFGLACAVFPTLLILALYLIPESPAYIAQKQPSSDLQHKNPATIFQTFQNDKASIKSLIIGLLLTSFRLFSGIDAITAYISEIFYEVDTMINPQFCSIIFAGVQVISGLLQTFIADRMSRKFLLIASEIIISISLFSCGSFYILKQMDTSKKILPYLIHTPLISLCGFIIAFSLGIGPIGILLTSEIFPNELRAFCLSLCTFLFWLFSFINIKLFSLTLGHLYYAFYLYSLISFLGSLFIHYYVPETKNKTLGEIRKTFLK